MREAHLLDQPLTCLSRAGCVILNAWPSMGAGMQAESATEMVRLLTRAGGWGGR